MAKEFSAALRWCRATLLRGGVPSRRCDQCWCLRSSCHADAGRWVFFQDLCGYLGDRVCSPAMLPALLYTEWVQPILLSGSPRNLSGENLLEILPGGCTPALEPANLAIVDIGDRERWCRSSRRPCPRGAKLAYAMVPPLSTPWPRYRSPCPRYGLMTSSWARPLRIEANTLCARPWLRFRHVRCAARLTGSGRSRCLGQSSGDRVPS